MNASHALTRAATALAFALAAGGAGAGAFSVSPVRIYMQPNERATAVTVVNESDEPVTMQADLFVWRQTPDAEERLEPTDDLVLSPPILTLAPRARQVVRLARLARPALAAQATYRMVLREVIEARPKEGRQSVQIALAFSIPIFVTPATAARRLACDAVRSGADALRVSCANAGTAYGQPREFVLKTAGGEPIAARDNGGYILPGSRRSFELRATQAAIPLGPASLAVTYDDSTTELFAVTVGP
jgi:fimbrial chaperone protein